MPTPTGWTVVVGGPECSRCFAVFLGVGKAIHLTHSHMLPVLSSFQFSIFCLTFTVLSPAALIAARSLYIVVYCEQPTSLIMSYYCFAISLLIVFTFQIVCMIICLGPALYVE